MRFGDEVGVGSGKGVQGVDERGRRTMMYCGEA